MEACPAAWCTWREADTENLGGFDKTHSSQEVEGHEPIKWQRSCIICKQTVCKFIYSHLMPICKFSYLHYAAQSPDVGFAAVALLVEDLRGQVVGSSTDRLPSVSCRLQLGSKTKVPDFQLHRLVHKEVT